MPPRSWSEVIRPHPNLCSAASSWAAEGGVIREGGEGAALDQEQRMQQGPILKSLDGGGMSADEAAWASIADAAEVALTLPGLSLASARDLLEVWIGSRIAAGLPYEPRPLCGGVQLQA